MCYVLYIYESQETVLSIFWQQLIRAVQLISSGLLLLSLQCVYLYLARIRLNLQAGRCSFAWGRFMCITYPDTMHVSSSLCTPNLWNNAQTSNAILAFLTIQIEQQVCILALDSLPKLNLIEASVTAWSSNIDCALMSDTTANIFPKSLNILNIYNRQGV